MKLPAESRVLALLGAALMVVACSASARPTPTPSGSGGSGGNNGGAPGRLDAAPPGAGGIAGGAGGVAGGSGGQPDAGSAAGSAGAAAGGGPDGPGAPGQGDAAPSTLPPGVLGHPSAAVVYPKHEGFTLALVEEFDAPLDLDHDPVWTWSDGGLTEGGVRFVKDALAFRDGKLVITARNEAAPGSTSFAEAPLQASAGFVAAKALKSGELRTRFNNFRYGRYEARLEPPTSAGNFIATMFVLRTPKFQEWREIDIEVTADRPGGVMTNLIFANNVFSWNASIEDSVDGFPSGPGARPLPPGFANQPQLHTYAFEWIPGRITWLVDDVPVRVTVPGKLPVPERSAKILMNLWVFAIAGGFGGDPTRNTYPLSSEYDWFRFYKWNGDDRYPCAAPPACLPPEDLDRSKNNPDDGLPP